jgi:hypothetical protein
MQGNRLREYIERARHLDNRDHRFYELAIGTAFTKVFPILQELAANPEMTEDQIVAKLAVPLTPLRADIDGLARFSPARAAVLKVLVDGAVELVTARRQGDTAMRSAVQRAWRAALDVRRRHPGEPDAYHLVFVLTGLGPAPTADLEAAVRVDVPSTLPTRDAVLLARAIVYQRLVVDRGLIDHAGTLAQMVAAIPAPRSDGWEARNLRADAVAISAVAGAGPWDAVADAYRQLLAAAPDDAERARIENNIGVALERAGKPSEAAAAWDRAMRLGPAYPVPDLNHAATSGGSTYALEKLTSLADSAELSGIGFQAAAWRRHFGLARGEKDQKTIAQLRADSFDRSLDMVAADGGLGFITAGSFKVSFGYHSTKQLVIELATESRTWLCLPAPGTATVTKPARPPR